MYCRQVCCSTVRGTAYSTAITRRGVTHAVLCTISLKPGKRMGRSPKLGILIEFDLHHVLSMIWTQTRCAPNLSPLIGSSLLSSPPLSPRHHHNSARWQPRQPLRSAFLNARLLRPAIIRGLLAPCLTSLNPMQSLFAFTSPQAS